MLTSFELRRYTATLIFDLEDRFARERGVRQPHPRPFEPLKFLVTAQGVGAGRRAFEPPLELVVRRNGGGYHIFNNQVRLKNGTVLKRALADDLYDLRVEGRFYQSAEQAAVALPRPDVALSLDLLPGYFYPFPTESVPLGGHGFALLRGALHTTDGRGLAGAQVAVAGALSSYVTDETGQWVLIFPDAFFPALQTTMQVTVDVTPPGGGPIVSVTGVDVDKGRERALGETALRGQVLTTAGTVIPGAVVEVQGQPGQTATASDGSWFYYFDLNQPVAPLVDVTARLPDGRTQTQNNQPVQTRATVAVPTFRFS